MSGVGGCELPSWGQTRRGARELPEHQHYRVRARRAVPDGLGHGRPPPPPLRPWPFPSSAPPGKPRVTFQDALLARGSRSLGLWPRERFESSGLTIQSTRRRSRARAAHPTRLFRSPAPALPARVGAKDTSGRGALSERLRPRNRSCRLRGSLAALFLSVTPPLRSPVNARRDHASN